VEFLLHPQQTRRLRLLQPRDGDPRPAAHDEGDLFLAQHRAVRLSRFSHSSCAPGFPLELALVVAQRRRPLEVLVAHRRVLLGVDLLQLRP
jgi:hypothetical protein